ncbi:MAG: Rieske 2Fe-2S domain-containing protein [Bacteroidota bacterium]
MGTGRFIDRKTFLRLATLAVASAFGALWYMLAGAEKRFLEKPVTYRVDASKLGPGVHLFDHFIIIKSGRKLNVLSNRCTHAGCRISRETNGILICPCHGSRYNATDGKVLQGPALLPLPSLPYLTDVKTGELVIKI